MSFRPANRLRLVSHALTVVGAVFAAFYWWVLTSQRAYGWDAGIYYGVRLDDLYGGWIVGGADSFQYAPVFAQLVAVVRSVLSYDAFIAIWRAVDLAIVVYLAGPLTLPVLLWGPVASEVNAGNVNLFLALAVAIGLRHPGAWTAVLLTKITPGVGVLWFVVRREWRSLATVAGVTAVVVAVSFALSPGQWVAWAALIAGHSSDNVVTFPYWVPLLVRLPIAAVLVVVAARFGWRWIVPLAATLAAPVLYFPTQAIAIGALPSLRATAGAALRTGADRLRARSATRQPARERADVPAQVVR